MFKKLIALVFAVALIGAACGDSTEDTTPTTTGDTTVDTPVDTEPPPTTGDVGQGGGTLAAVQARGTLVCGVSGSAVAFSETQPDGSVTGFDADWCRAIAAAVTGSADNVEFRPLTAAERFEALNNGEVDVLIRNTTWTQSRDTDIGMDFGPTTYYDGQQLMGLKSRFSADSTLADVDGAVLCTNAGTTTEKNITEGAAQAGATITLETVETFPEAMEKFQAGQCDLVTTDGSGLVGNKATLDTNDEWVIFPSSPISKEPLGPVYRSNDSQWGDVVNWTVFAAIIADEQGVTSGNVADKLAELTPTHDATPTELGRLLGLSGELQSAMGLSADAFFNSIQQVGNYDEIYSRNLNPVGLVRDGSLNASFTNFGLIYAPPAR